MAADKNVISHIWQYLELQMEFLCQSKFKIGFWDTTKPIEKLLKKIKSERKLPNNAKIALTKWPPP